MRRRFQAMVWQERTKPQGWLYSADDDSMSFTKANCDTDTRVNSPRLITALGGLSLLRTTVATLSLTVADGLGFANSILLARMLGAIPGFARVRHCHVARGICCLRRWRCWVCQCLSHGKLQPMRHMTNGIISKVFCAPFISDEDVAGRYRDGGDIHALAGDWRFQSDRVVGPLFWQR